MLKKLLCKIAVRLIGGEIKSIDNNYYVQIRRISLEGNIKTRPFGFISIGLYIPIIIVEGNYDNIFNEDEMRFVLYHEFAHCKYNHFKLPGRHIEQEIEADIFAMRMVGKDIAISALEKVKEEARWTCHGATEAALRIFECEHVML